MPVREECDNEDSAACVTRPQSRASHGCMTMYVDALWRYPVKSLASERLSSAEIGSAGIAGDRQVRVCGPEGVRTARRHYRLLGLSGTLDAEGSARINGY